MGTPQEVPLLRSLQHGASLGSGLELGHEPGREPERRPGCGLGTEPWRELLLLLENCQTANTLTQVPEGARFTLEAERGKPKDTMTMKLDLNACPDIPRSKRGGQGSPECPPRDLPSTANMSKHAAWVRRRATGRALILAFGEITVSMLIWHLAKAMGTAKILS